MSTGIKWLLRVALLSSLVLPLVPAPGRAQQADLFGGVGRVGANRGALITINQATGAGALIGPGVGPVAGLTGLAFDTAGALFGSTLSDPFFEPGAGGAPTLVRLDVHTGVVLASAPITLGGSALAINDLAAQPGTGLLFGTSLSTTTFVNSIYTIDKGTGVATLVGSTGVTGETLAFGPDGTLYQTSSVFGAQGFLQGFLNTLNPATGAVLTTSAAFTLAHVGGLAVRPTDGAIFATGGQGGDLYRLSASGQQTFVGLSGRGGVGDIAFVVVPEPSTLALLGTAVLPLAGVVARKRRRAAAA
jgi:hypothetical protein